MGLLKKFKDKLFAKARAKELALDNAREAEMLKLDPTMKTWGYEILFDQLLEAMNPENYDVKEKDGLYVIIEKYAVLDAKKEATGEYEWKRRYSHDHDTDKPGHFSTFEKALKSIENIIAKAAKDFDIAKSSLEDE